MKHGNLRQVIKCVMTIALLLAAACGTSSVQMVVVRPAVINARPYGGSVSIAGFQPLRPEFYEVASQFHQELAAAVINSVGGVVQLRDSGGLIASGQIRDYSVQLTERQRIQQCTDRQQVTQSGVTTTQNVQHSCTYYWLDWHAHVAVTFRVTSSQGQTLYWRNHFAERRGTTSQVRDNTPIAPFAPPILRELRAQVVEQLAAVIVPHRVRVTATFYDCKPPAEDACAQGVKFMAASNYDAALAAYSDAIARITAAKLPPAELAKAYYDRGLVFEYSRRFDEAIADYKYAITLDDSSAYRNALASVERERTNHNQLIDQGLGQ